MSARFTSPITAPSPPRRDLFAPPHHPQNRAPGARGDPREKQGCGAIFGHVARSGGDLVQRVEPEPTIRQPRIERLHSEGQHRSATETLGLHRAQLLAKLGKDGRIGHRVAAATHDSGTRMFPFCSSWPQSQSRRVNPCLTMLALRDAPLSVLAF
jgi:hypothetical protein